MMVGYIHNSTTVWRIWDPEFKAVKAHGTDEGRESGAHGSTVRNSNASQRRKLPART
ncbi:hypothetical protein BDD12DRAFT_870837, partial [Trichophaea hybrida]